MKQDEQAVTGPARADALVLATDSTARNESLRASRFGSEQLDASEPSQGRQKSATADAKPSQLKESGEEQATTVHQTSAEAGELAEFRPSNRYELISRVGQGGFGVVYLAYDQQLKRNVALKMPRPDVLLTKSMAQRFLREARNVAKLDHPNIVPVLATDETSQMPAIVYPFCSGPTLALWLHSRSTPTDFRLAANIVMLLAEAVQHAHARGILHRDLKLANILLEPTTECDHHQCISDGLANWIPRVTDFGISKSTQGDEDATVTGSVMGTLEYMAPEQIRGLTNDIGSHSDVYSLGVILFELLVRKRPYSGDSGADLILRMQSSGPPLIRTIRPEVPRDLEAIVSKCLSVSLEQRYATAANLAEDLKNFLNCRPVQARKNSVAVRASRWVLRQPVVATLSGVCIVLVLLAIAGTIGYIRQVNQSIAVMSSMYNQLQASRTVASAERDRATNNAIELSEQLYAADISAAAKALEDGDLSNYHLLLNRQIKPSSDEDLRDIAWHILWRKGHRDCDAITASSLPLYAVQISNSQEHLAVCGADGNVTIYDSRTLQKKRSWNAGQGELNLASFSSDDQLISTSGDDGTVCIWNTETGERVRRFRAHREQVFQSLFGLGDTLISCGNEETIRVWNWRTGDQLAELVAHKKTVQTISLSKDRKQLFSASDDGTRGVWDLTSNQLFKLLPNVHSRVLDVEPAPDQPFVFSSAVDGSVRRESLDSDAEPQNTEIAKLTDSAECLAVSPNGKRLAMANRTGCICILELDKDHMPTTQANTMITKSWFAHPGRIYDIAFTSDSRTLLSVGHDGRLRRWEAEPDETPARLDISSLMTQGANCPGIAQLAPDACMIAFGRSLTYWKPGSRWEGISGETESNITRFAASIQKQTIFTGELSGEVRAWSKRGEKFEQTWNFAWPKSAGHVTGLAYSEARNWVASEVELPSNQVNLHDADTGEVVRQLQLPATIQGKNDGSLTFSADGKWLASAVKNHVVVWDLETFTPRCLTGHTHTVSSVCFHPNCRWVASASADRTVRIWDVKTEACLADLRHHRELAESVVFSPDGRCLFSSDQGGKTVIWHTSTGRMLMELDKHAGQVNFDRNWSGSVLFRSIDFKVVQADVFQSDVGRQSLPGSSPLVP